MLVNDKDVIDMWTSADSTNRAGYTNSTSAELKLTDKYNNE